MTKLRAGVSSQPQTKRPIRPSTWIGLTASGLWLFTSFAAAGIAGFLIAAGTLAFITSLYVLITGRSSWAMIQSRKAATLVLAGALVACTVGGSLSPKQADSAASIVQFADQAANESQLSSPSPTVSAPVVKTVDKVVTEAVPFEATTVDDPNLTAGVTQISTVGVPGTRTTTYRVTTKDGRETSRVVVSDVISVAPIAQVTSNGTYVAPPPPPPPVAAACDGNYSGPCVPIASDVDCAGGSGNGPAYVSGPVFVVGSDIYDLDRDGDGIACD